MGVVFHLAVRQDWERASSAGGYTTASLHRDGFIHCSTATQHAAVADARFAGRIDLVLLLIDVDRLSSKIRFEWAGARGEAFPHVYGPVDLDAVFEATPYHPGAMDGSIRMRRPAGSPSMARRPWPRSSGGRWRRWPASSVLGGWRAGGRLTCSWDARRGRTPTWRSRSSPPTSGRYSSSSAAGTCVLPLRGRRRTRGTGARSSPRFIRCGRAAVPAAPSAEEFAADPTMLGFLLEQGHARRWVFRRHPAVTRPPHEVGATTADGVRFVRPEIALLFKAKAPRFRDQRDFDRVLPRLDAAARGWLASALQQVYPGHTWRARL